MKQQLLHHHTSSKSHAGGSPAATSATRQQKNQNPIVFVIICTMSICFCFFFINLSRAIFHLEFEKGNNSHLDCDSKNNLLNNNLLRMNSGGGGYNSQSSRRSSVKKNTDCYDERDEEDCKEWANNGDCSHNYKFMLKKCRKSCYVCFDDYNEVPDWLNKITIGKVIAEGTVASVFEASVKGEKPNSHIIKFSGVTPYEDGSIKNIKRTSNEIDIVTNHLMPHRSIPNILYSVDNIPNIFKDNSTSLNIPVTTDDEWKDWLLECTSFSIIVADRIVQTTKHIDSDWEFTIPNSFMLHCFIKQVFEAMAHAHKMGVMNRDLHNNNILIENGQVKLFDWNLGIIYDETAKQLVWEKQVSSRHDTSLAKYDHRIDPPENREKSFKDMIYFVNVHGYDVWRLGGLLSDILEIDDDDESDEDSGESDGDDNDSKNTNRTTVTTTKKILTSYDKILIKDMVDLMMVTDPIKRPTIQYLLDNHEYFNNQTTMTKPSADDYKNKRIDKKTGECLLIW